MLSFEDFACVFPFLWCLEPAFPGSHAHFFLPSWPSISSLSWALVIFGTDTGSVVALCWWRRSCEPRPALAFECHPQHPPTQRGDLLTCSHQKWKLEQAQTALTLLAFSYYFGHYLHLLVRKQRLFLFLKMLLKPHGTAEIICLSGLCHSEGRGPWVHNEDGGADNPGLFHVTFASVCNMPYFKSLWKSSCLG